MCHQWRLPSSLGTPWTCEQERLGWLVARRFGSRSGVVMTAGLVQQALGAAEVRPAHLPKAEPEAREEAAKAVVA